MKYATEKEETIKWITVARKTKTKTNKKAHFEKVTMKRKKHPAPLNSDNDTDEEEDQMDILLIETFKNRMKRNVEKTTGTESSNKKQQADVESN